MKANKRITHIIITSIIITAVMMIFCTACGKNQRSEDKLTGSLSDIMADIYENADLSDDFRESLEFFEKFELTEDMETSILGTDEINYVEGVVSMPMMSSVAFQCVLLRVEENDVDTVKQQIKDNADLNKWVCVSAETMLIESRGDVIFFVMGENDTAYALNAAFQAY